MTWYISICLKKTHWLSDWLTANVILIDFEIADSFYYIFFFIRDCVFSWIASNVRTMKTYRLNFVLFVFFVIDIFIKKYFKKNGMKKAVPSHVYNRKISKKYWHFSQFGILIKQSSQFQYHVKIINSTTIKCHWIN